MIPNWMTCRHCLSGSMPCSLGHRRFFQTDVLDSSWENTEMIMFLYKHYHSDCFFNSDSEISLVLSMISKTQICKRKPLIVSL